MAGKRRLNGNLRSFKITNLANHDGVWVLPQNGAQRFGKRQINFGVDLRLANARQLVFNRVFHRHDVSGGCIEALQGRIQRGGFARTGGARHQNNAVRLRDELRQAGEHVALHANGLKA